MKIVANIRRPRVGTIYSFPRNPKRIVNILEDLGDSWELNVTEEESIKRVAMKKEYLQLYLDKGERIIIKY